MKHRRVVLTAVLFVLALPTGGTSQSLPADASPESVGVSSERIARVDGLLQSYIDRGRMAGAVVVIVRRGKLLHAASLGRMDLDEDRPMREDAIFRMASMTKPITSVAALMLYEEGRFQLEDPVSWYIPEFAAARAQPPIAGASQTREMTIRDLLTHTAGLPANGADASYNEVLANRDRSLQELMEELGELPLAYWPGTEWRYGHSTGVLGYLVEAVSGQPFEQFLSGRIFEPLEMVDTGFFVPASKAHRVASSYTVDDHGLPEEQTSGLAPEETQPPKAPNGSGGLFSTASDYLKFSQMLLNGGELNGVRLLGRKTVELMTTDHLPPGVHLPVKWGQRYRFEGYGFGLGVRVRTDIARSQMLGSLGEYGWGGAWGTYFLIDPEEELVAMFLTQLRGSAYYPIRRQFNNAVYQALIN